MRPSSLTSVLLVCIACTAHAYPNPSAVPGIRLSWNNCTGVGDASQNVNYACDGSRDGQPYKAVFSFFAPASMDSFVGVQAFLDFTVGTPTLPDWWTFVSPYASGSQDPGPGCRIDAFTYPVPFSGIGDTTCVNPWTAGKTGGGWAYYFQNKGDNPTTPTPWPGYGRIKFAFARDSGKHLDQGTHYLAGVFTLDLLRDVDTGNGVCGGCALPACLVMTELELYQVAGSPPQDIFYMYDPIGGTITWQGGNVGIGCPASVPVRRSTWGSIKATYR